MEGAKRCFKGTLWRVKACALFMAILVSVPIALAQSLTPAEKQLEGHTVLLRGFPAGDKIRYSESGEPEKIVVDNYFRLY